ncbi:MAG: uroporphyrinogen decarboxylase family protein [Bacteroidales bacterium]|nr:uroporphyrinogen decarboxylase family protein [Bacteroidales bacterium]
MKKWIDEIMRTHRVAAVPIMTHPGIELIGKTVRDAVTDGQVHFQAVKKLSEVYPSAACTTIMDLTVEAEAFGAPVNMPENEIPTVYGRLVGDADGVASLQVPDLTAGRVPQYLLANRLCAQAITDRPVFGGCIGPFSLAGRLYDMSEIMMAIYIEPDTISLLLDKCTRFIMQYCQAIKEAGSAGVVMAEPAAGLLSDEDSVLFSTKYVKRVVEAVQDDSFTVILHNCGNTGHCTRSMVESGARALHFGNRADMPRIIAEVPDYVVVMGNIDPVGVFKQADSQEVGLRTSELLRQMSGHSNFVVSSGCDLPPLVPESNIKAFFQAVDEFNEQV